MRPLSGEWDGQATDRNGSAPAWSPAPTVVGYASLSGRSTTRALDRPRRRGEVTSRPQAVALLRLLSSSSMQPRNPFEPPRATLDLPKPPSDFDVALERRPATIDRAFWLIVSSAGLGLVSYIARGMNESPAMVALVMAYIIGFAFLIRAGKNWARIVYLVFQVLGLLGVVYAGAALARVGLIYVLILGIQTVFQCYAAWLAFRPPGRAWFSRVHTVR